MNKHPNLILKNHLVSFWKKFKGGKKHSRQQKLDALIALSKVVIYYKRQQSLQKRRAIFQKIKYHRHDMKKYPNCYVCGEIAECRHHIIPLTNGGINSRKNLVSLCNHCHCDIHPWMERPKEKPVTKTLAAFCDSLDM